MTSMDITAAVDRYLAPRPDERSGVPLQDLVKAAVKAGNWRRNGPAATAAILYTLHTDHAYTLRALESVAGIPMKTCDRLIETHRTAIGGGRNV